MHSMIDSFGVVCRRCGRPVGVTDVAVYHSAFDPLEVTECPRCGAVVDIGGRGR